MFDKQRRSRPGYPGTGTASRQVRCAFTLHNFLMYIAYSPISCLRTLFLLQCIFKCLLSGGSKPLVVPLSLGTTSKKLLKVIEDEATLKQQQPVVSTQGTSK